MQTILRIKQQHYILLRENTMITKSIIKQGDSDSEVKLCSGTKFKLSVDLIQLLKVITVWVS